MLNIKKVREKPHHKHFCAYYVLKSNKVAGHSSFLSDPPPPPPPTPRKGKKNIFPLNQTSDLGYL